MKLPGAVSFDTLSDARLTQWMNQTLRPFGKKMDANTCARLAFTSGRDLTMLSGELQKLAGLCRRSGNHHGGRRGADCDAHR